MLAGRSHRRTVPPARAIALLGLTALLLLAPTVAARPVASSDPTFASDDTGSVQIVLPSAVPVVDLTQDANHSLAASLVLDRVVEVNASTSDPQIVARATVTDARSFNATPSAGGPVVAGLSANLTVFHASGDLFPPAGVTGHLTPSVPIAPTTIVVTVRTTSSAGTVDVSAQVSGWPWIATTDLLAIGWTFDVGTAAHFSGCTAAVPTSVASAPCGPDPFASQNSSWNDPLDGVQAVDPNGPAASLAWTPTVSTSNGADPTIVGVQRSSVSPDTTEVVLGASAHGASSVEYGVAYALVLPTVVSDLVHGSLVPYLGGALGAVVLGAGAIVYVRRRDRRLLDAL